MTTLKDKTQEIVDAFSSFKTPEETYAYIMELGKRQVKLSTDEKLKEHLVRGCQTELYLITQVKEGLVYFKAYADALISSGLAQLLIWFYNGSTPEEVLKTPPTFLEELKIPASLSPSRANGLYNIHLRMKQEALKGLVKVGLPK